MCTLTSPSNGRGTPRRSSETIPGSPFGNHQNELLGEKEGRWRKAKKKKNELVSDCESDMSDEVGNEKKRRIQEKESAIDAGGRGTPRSASREIPGSPFATAETRYLCTLHVTQYTLYTTRNKPVAKSLIISISPLCNGAKFC